MKNRMLLAGMVLFIGIAFLACNAKVRKTPGKISAETLKKIEQAKRKNRLKRKESAEAGKADHPARYVGVMGCKTCHPAQYSVWTETRHGLAFKRLFTSKAKKIAQDLKIKKAHEAPECLKCHTTGHGLPVSRFKSTFTLVAGVQCEACHGPGERYREEMDKNDDEEKDFEDKGLIMPAEDECLTCHNSSSPTFKGFDFDRSFEEIEHPWP